MKPKGTKTFTIEVAIDGEGVIIGEVKGLRGKQCHGKLDFLDRMGTVRERRDTDEAKLSELGQSVQQTQKIGGA